MITENEAEIPKNPIFKYNKFSVKIIIYIINDLI